MSSVAVIIVNFRTAELVTNGLAAIAAERASLTHSIITYVVDNNSGDELVKIISDAVDREGWGTWVRVRPNATNDGFSAGNNVALREILRAGTERNRIVLMLKLSMSEKSL